MSRTATHATPLLSHLAGLERVYFGKIHPSDVGWCVDCIFRQAEAVAIPVKDVLGKVQHYLLWASQQRRGWATTPLTGKQAADGVSIWLAGRLRHEIRTTEGWGNLLGGSRQAILA